MPQSPIERIVAQRLVHRLVSERLVERVYNQPLIGNVERGAYVECMIELALSEIRPMWELTETWDAWDLEQSETRARIEVKNSASAQTWTARTPPKSVSPPSFDIAPRTGYYSGATWFDTAEPQRFADLYIFALHDIADLREADQRLPSQWQFYVVASDDLPAGQKRISLNPLRELEAACSFDQLAERVATALSGIEQLKVGRLP